MFVCHKHFEQRFESPMTHCLKYDAYLTLFTDLEISSESHPKSITNQNITVSKKTCTDHTYTRKYHIDHSYSNLVESTPVKVARPEDNGINADELSESVMPSAKYAQLSIKNEDDEVEETKPQRHCLQLDNNSYRMALPIMMMLLYFGLSISLTFYQRWLLQGFSFPLTVALYHLVVKWCLSVVVRTVIYAITGYPQLCLSFVTSLRAVAPTGLASGVDVGFSNWGLALVTISLYTMTKSTTIIFILIFAILLGLERKSWSLVGIVLAISLGLVMFTYKATQFDLLGFVLLLMASFAAGLRWSFAQHLMQKAKLGLHNPVDMVFHVQPWMFISLLPAVVMFEGVECFRELAGKPSEEMWSMVVKISVGAYIAFAMEISEFLVVTYTSSLTLSIAGIFKEMCILVLAVKINGDQLSTINLLGFALCLTGIACHVTHKAVTMRKDPSKLVYKIQRPGEYHAPLLDQETVKSASEDSDNDANILFEVIQRRDAR